MPLEDNERSELDEVKRVINGMSAAQQQYMQKTDKHQEILEKLEHWLHEKGAAVEKTV